MKKGTGKQTAPGIGQPETEKEDEGAWNVIGNGRQPNWRQIWGSNYEGGRERSNLVWNTVTM